jgi:hypothetical protein
LQNGVAVGRRLRDHIRGGIAAGTGTVLDDDGLAERFGELLAHDAREQIDGATGHERHHDPDRLRRIGLRRGGHGAEQDKRACDQECRPSHGVLPVWTFIAAECPLP